MIPLSQTVHLDEIEWEDDTFRVDSFGVSQLLETSLENSGILRPPSLLSGDSSRYTIVDGYKRLLWARLKGQASALCSIYSCGTDAPGLMFERLTEKCLGLPLNTAEKARVLLLSHTWFPGQSTDQFLYLLGIPRRREITESWLSLARCEIETLMAAASGVICESAALELAGWDHDARIKAIEIFRLLQCSASIQGEILERVREIAVRRSIETETVLKDLEICSILQDKSLNHREKTTHIRELLARWRLPRLYRREERFRQELARADLPKGIQIVPPKSFEGGVWELHVKFKSSSELTCLLREALRLSESSRVDKLLASDTDTLD